MSSAARGGASVGVVRKAWDAAIDWVMRKEMVGTDKHGNKYYRYFENNRGDKVERREVKWNTVYMMYDPNDVPSEWRMWLRKLRAAPPTPEELERSDVKAQVLKAKVAVLDEQDRLRRLRMQSMGMHAHQTSQQPDISSLLQSMGSEAAAAKRDSQAGPADRQGSWEGDAPGTRAPGGRTSDAAARDAGANARAAEETPTSSGGAFTPGVWKPGQ